MSVEQSTVPGILKQVNSFYVSLLVRDWFISGTADCIAVRS